MFLFIKSFTNCLEVIFSTARLILGPLSDPPPKSIPATLASAPAVPEIFILVDSEEVDGASTTFDSYILGKLKE